MAAVIAGALRALFIAGTLIFDTAQNGANSRRDLLRHIYLKSDDYAEHRFRSERKRWALRFMLIDMDLLMQVAVIINTWNDTELLRWNENLLGSFDAIAVAGSVLASVDITALSLDSVSDIHWTARAAFSVSLLSSVLSVVFGVRTQRQLYLIGGPKELRLWLSNGQPQDARELQSSIAAIRVLQLPVELLTLSWITFIVGLILYMSFMWRLHSDPGGVDYRNVLICILLVLLILVGYYELMGAIKDVEQGKALDPAALSERKDTDLENRDSASTAEPRVLQALQEFQVQLEHLRVLHENYQLHTKSLYDKSAEANVQDDYGNALQAASAGGHEQIVMLLLNKGIDVNVHGGRYGNALQAASAGGYESIVKLLMKEGADVNAQGGRYGNALQAAAAGGYDSIVKLLIKEGADVNAQGGRYGNALQAAAAGGYELIVELLLERGADVNAHYSSGSKFE